MIATGKKDGLDILGLSLQHMLISDQQEFSIQGKSRHLLRVELQPQ